MADALDDVRPRSFRGIDRHAIVLTVAAMVTLAWSSANAEVETALKTLPGEIQQLNSAGRWRSAEGEGFYRVIVIRSGWDRVVQRLYIQWMRHGDSENPAREVATAGIPAINEAGPFTFFHTVQAAATNQLRITIDARHGLTGRRQQFVVVATTPGIYTVREPRARSSPE